MWSNSTRRYMLLLNVNIVWICIESEAVTNNWTKEIWEPWRCVLHQLWPTQIIAEVLLLHYKIRQQSGLQVLRHMFCPSRRPIRWNKWCPATWCCGRWLEMHLPEFSKECNSFWELFLNQRQSVSQCYREVNTLVAFLWLWKHILIHLW